MSLIGLKHLHWRLNKSRHKNTQYSGMENDVYAAYCEDDLALVSPLLEYLKSKKVKVYNPFEDGLPSKYIRKFILLL